MPDAPDPTVLHPVPDQQRMVFLRPLVRDTRIEVGDYTYYDDPDDPEAFERDALLFAFGPERLVIGRYCAIGSGVRFVMPGSAHAAHGPSTFPFAAFGEPWSDHAPDVPSGPGRGDTVVGNDVWIGYQALVMPGVRIGDGAVVAARSVVTRDVAPYALVAGNPGREVRRRYDEDDVARLLAAAWWDWPPVLVTEHLAAIMAGTPADLERIAAENGLLRA